MKKFKMSDYRGGDEYQKLLHDAWLHFTRGESYDYSFMPPHILASWQRSQSAGVDSTGIVNKILSPDTLNVKINNNIKLIDVAHPYIERLYSIIKGSNSYTLLSDRDGYILDYMGDNQIIESSQAATHLVPGACRQETVAGTNAIGTALYLREPVQICGNEHYCKKHQIYTCSCAPILDHNDNLIGAVNVTVPKELAHPHTLGMVLSASDSIAKELELTDALQSIRQISMQRNSIIENMSSGIFLLTKTGRVSQVNTHALKMFSLSYEQIIGQNLSDFLDIDGVEPSVSEQGSMFEREMSNEEILIKRHNTNSIPKTFRLSVNFIRDNKGDISETLLIFNKTEAIHQLVSNVSGYKAHYTFDDIVGESEPVMKMLDACRKAAKRNSNVLILGESGTGKELVAQSIHNAGPSSRGPFLAINCASIPNTLVESELFGYEKGAFTGANRNGQPGKFEMANGGTIFLDEIGDMPLDIQAALLRVIQTKEVVRIGGKYPRPVDLRIIAATNQDLTEKIKDKTFRSDLYYRLNVFTINTPPLRERGSNDIRLLTDHFIDSYNRDKLSRITVTPEVYSFLENYNWPGNIRQLENVIERAINLCDDDEIIIRDFLPDEILNSAANDNPDVKTSDGVVSNAIAALCTKNSQGITNTTQQSPKLMSAKENEKQLIYSALEATGGNMTKASRLLDINLRTLYRRLEKYGIEPESFRS